MPDADPTTLCPADMSPIQIVLGAPQAGDEILLLLIALALLVYVACAHVHKGRG